MADMMKFDLVSPERRLASVEASQVQIPGADGDMTAMPDHVPTITTLRPGVLRVQHSGGTDDYVVSGGFAEISGESVTVLAEEALPKGDLTQDMFDRMVKNLRERHAKAQEAYANEPGPVDEAAKLLGDMVAIGSEMGLSTN